MSAPESTANTSAPARRTAGYPLAALFVLIAVCAILLGMLTPIFRQVVAGTLDMDLLVKCTAAGGICGVFLGGFIGMFSRPWYIATPMAVGAGLALGLACGPLFLTTADGLPAVLVSCVGGAVVIVAIALFVRLAARDTES